MLVRIVGIQRFKDRHGKLRLYYRRKGAPRVALDPSLDGAELAAEVERLNKLHVKPKARAGTLRHVIISYKANSNQWKELRPRTRKDYERVFTWLRDAVNLPIVDITGPEIAKTRDKARDQHEAKFANQVVTTLKMVFRHGVEYGMMPTNPALGLEKATGGRRRANVPWLPQEVVTALAGAPIGLRAGIALAAYCGIREGDVCAMARNAPIGDWLGFIQGKTRRHHEAFICGDLRAILAQLPAHDATTLLVSSKGQPWTLEGFKTAWDRYRSALIKKGLIRPGLTFHGLRHTGATILEENGYEEGQTKHFLGHGPKTVSGHYGKSASRRKIVEEMSLVIEAEYARARGNLLSLGDGKV
jgi:integrase